jgi:hypothetical protein
MPNQQRRDNFSSVFHLSIQSGMLEISSNYLKLWPGFFCHDGRSKDEMSPWFLRGGPLDWLLSREMLLFFTEALHPSSPGKLAS